MSWRISETLVGLSFESQTLRLQGPLGANASLHWPRLGAWALTILQWQFATLPSPRDHESNKQSFALQSLTHYLTFTYFLHHRQRNLLSHKHSSINHQITHPSCIARIPCDKVALRLPRKSRTHPHHHHPQSRVVSLARAALVSHLPLYYSYKQQFLALFSFSTGVLWKCAQ